MAFTVGDEIVVNANRLFRDKLMRRYVYTFGQWLTEVPGHPAPQGRQGFRTRKTSDNGSERDVKQAEFVLFVEIGRGQLPRSNCLKPVKPVKPLLASAWLHAVPYEVLERQGVVFD